MASEGENVTVPDYNLLLLGESGCGKSMLINAFNYYARCDTLDEAKKNDSEYLIPFQFKFKDKGNVERTITELVGPWKDNECLGGVKSATAKCRSYPFNFQDYNVRLIDTAGVGDTNGQEEDINNVQDVLNFIEKFENLNAIGIVIKSDQARCSPTFKYCMKQLLVNLDKAAVNNILFIFTCSETCEYEPGPAKDAFQEILKELYDAKTALSTVISNKNIFCFENKWLRYRSAFKRGFGYKERAVRSFEDAWEESQKEFKRLLDYVIGLDKQPGLQPHEVKNIMSINDARKYIKIIYPIFDQILLNVAKNRANLGEQMKDIESGLSTVLKPIVAIQFREVVDAKTVCRSEKCRQGVEIDGKMVYEYPQVCCPGCTVPFGLRVFCQQMELFSGNCKVLACQCPASEHQRINYIKEEVSKEIMSREDLRNIEKATSKTAMIFELLKVLTSQKCKLEDEANIVKNAMLVFSKFLQYSTVAPPSPEVVEAYKKVESKASKVKINRKENDTAMETLIKETAKSVDEVWDIKPADVQRMITYLNSMAIYGPQIENAYNIQKEAYARDHQFQEIKIMIKKSLKSLFGHAVVKGALANVPKNEMRRPD